MALIPMLLLMLLTVIKLLGVTMIDAPKLEDGDRDSRLVTERAAEPNSEVSRVLTGPTDGVADTRVAEGESTMDASETTKRVLEKSSDESAVLVNCNVVETLEGVGSGTVEGAARSNELDVGATVCVYASLPVLAAAEESTEDSTKVSVLVAPSSSAMELEDDSDTTSVGVEDGPMVDTVGDGGCDTAVGPSESSVDNEADAPPGTLGSDVCDEVRMVASDDALSKVLEAVMEMYETGDGL